MKFDNAFPHRGGYIVQKDDLYGIADKDGNLIIPCKFVECSDVLNEWKEIDYSLVPVEQTQMQKARDAICVYTKSLEEQGKILTYKSDDYYVLSSCFVKLEDGRKGIAESIMGKNGIVIFEYPSGKIVKTIDKDSGLFKIDSDHDYLYCGVYNSINPFVACYKQGSFEEVWKTPMPSASIQGVAVGDNYVLAYDVKSNCIYFLDKATGTIDMEKTIPNANARSLDVYANDIYVGTQSGVFQQHIDEITGLISSLDDRSISTHGNQEHSYDFNGLTVDKKNNKIYIALDDIIGVIGEHGFEGCFTARTGEISSIKLDSDTGNLLISMCYGRGEVDVYTPEAIKDLLEYSSEFMLNQPAEINKLD